MKYYSTNNKAHVVGLREAVIEGLAPDNGLYMPAHLRPMSSHFLGNLAKRTPLDMAMEVAVHLIDEDIPATELAGIVQHTISFDVPLVLIEPGAFALELFHGPTLAFKDFGARFLSGLLGYYARQQDREITILVATSGDTGSAVANGFYNVQGTKVIVLYPSGKVSDIQEKQFTTLGGNITALEIDGTFDDCQRLVKQAFLDKDLKRKLFLTSANSINIGRLIPQTFYYFFAMANMAAKARPVVFSVPSGNFGNLTAGLLAKRLGLPIHQFVAATNQNDVVPEYIYSGSFTPRASQQTISNAMDVGNPSNFARMLDLYDSELLPLSKDIVGYAFTDDETRSIMREIYDRQGYVLDPHGAVGLLGLRKYLGNHSGVEGIFLETAHPGKFKSVVDTAIHAQVPLPDRLQNFISKQKKTTQLGSSFEEFKTWLVAKNH